MKDENNPGYVEFMITRLLKKNHEALLKLEKKSAEMFTSEDNKECQEGYEKFTKLDSLT